MPIKSVDVLTETGQYIVQEVTLKTNVAVEVVPFRLTRNMVNGFGPTGVEGSFRRSCESTLRVMRENKDTLLTVIQTFVHDPLLEWINTEARAQQNKGRGQQKVNAPSTESVQLILKRLEGHIVSPEVCSVFHRRESVFSVLCWTKDG
ncbi:hypothetical protein OESDEN_04583 [Oesophagostomum dentatum]|uniref:PI3K/PI4K catalytic domain-containing protein n=1 Tax=Oesophagostomum dentatum TaxID=61180 RepID=A0A0B1TDY0_OESDE|nr:hypothetical protein OESDEN_04583 [Oesophagostomum dentatum]